MDLALNRWLTRLLCAFTILRFHRRCYLLVLKLSKVPFNALFDFVKLTVCVLNHSVKGARFYDRTVQ
jgi:hypothetical protein